MKELGLLYILGGAALTGLKVYLVFWVISWLCKRGGKALQEQGQDR